MPRFLATTHDLPAGPPPEVLQQIDVAWERARELFESDLELHFEVDALIGRVWAELRWADGSIVEILSASEVLALACGDATADMALAV
ncbi:MAG: hypothetical protein ACR2L8_13285 [Solirubrobacteraceae bacterium]